MKVEMQLGNEQLSIETGHVARQADGAAWVQYGGTVVLVTAIAERQPNLEVGFFSFTVDFRGSAYAPGRIPGGYGWGEPRPGGTGKITARVIEPFIRPLYSQDVRY